MWPDAGKHSTYDAGLSALRGELSASSELRTVIDIGFDSARHTTINLQGPLATVPLKVHARYQREEILAALDYANLSRKPTSVMQGVAYVPELNTDILFVTLKKSEADYSPTTMYRDYPISPTLLLWESLSTGSLASPTGQRYVNGTSQVLLFARNKHQDEYGTAPYVFLGPVTQETRSRAAYRDYVASASAAIRKVLQIATVWTD